ncbi:uncharacterized protein LOC134672705 [Cydia fagiglandana]|uniref:uncharacterized protein LOC134672705 n=1 Tax=Cydia fagiglandana TaxID=1458189 RepID=UPI002FEE23C2
MAILKHATCLLLLLAVISLVLGQTAQGGPHITQGGAHESQGGAHEDQGRVKRQAEQDGDEDSGVVSWTTCDQTTTPKYSCQDCTTRLICLPIGGKVLACPSVYRPYCNNGRCSAIPSAGCA